MTELALAKAAKRAGREAERKRVLEILRARLQHCDPIEEDAILELLAKVEIDAS